MGTMSRPHAGSLAFYPRKRARKEMASFSSFPAVEVKEGEKAKPLSFVAYKAGMTHVLGKDVHEKGITFGHEVAIAATVLEAPPIKVFGVRAYGKAPKGFYGTVPLMDVFAENVDKNLLKKITNFKKKTKKKKKKGKEKAEAEEKKEDSKKKAEDEKKAEEEAKKEDLEKPKTMADLEKAKEKVLDLRLLCHTQPGKTKFGKKRPDVCEIGLSGNTAQKMAFAKDVLGKEISVSDVFEENQFVDVRAVTKGKGMQGPVKRAGIKVHRPKAKKRRVVGSIGPWNPSTVMWTVPRPGQMGYHSRTELHKKILKIGSEKDTGLVNQKAGFKNYGRVGNDFIVLVGSVAGPAKRAVSVRFTIRKTPFERHKIEKLDYVAGSSKTKDVVLEEEVKVEHVVEKKEEKKEKKSVADEIAAAAKGEEKREKNKEK